MLRNELKTNHAGMVGLFLSTVATLSTNSFASPSQYANSVIRFLTKKAQTYKETGESPRGINDFYFSPQHNLDVRVFEQNVIKPTNRDPFIDAYVRWQLIRFDIDLPNLSEVAFKNFLESLPEFPENPRINTTYCDSVARAGAIDRPLSEPEIDSLKQRIEEVSKQYAVTKSQTRPADQFRLWVIEQLQDQPSRLALAHLERLAATVSAGWPSKNALSQAEKAFVLINKQGYLPDSAQKDIDHIAYRITGINRLSLVHVDISCEGRISPYWQSTAIDAFDLKRLLRLLRKSNEETDGFLGRDRQPPKPVQPQSSPNPPPVKSTP